MKVKHIIAIITFLSLNGILSSCLLQGDSQNTPPGAVSPFLIMTNNPNGSGIVNSGLQYFGNQALLYSPADAVDTATFAVALEGTTSYNTDINVTLTVKQDALTDNLANDGINYAIMPSTYYEFISTTGVIKAGERYAEFQVKFFPNMMDWKANTMLPITATNDVNLPIASNFGVVYYHVVGTPIAGVYNWDFTRYNVSSLPPGPTATPCCGSFTGETTIFAPVNATTVTTPTGYYTQPNYIITFSDDGMGNLSNFKAIIDPKVVNGDWASVGITIVSGPTIQVATDYSKFTLHWQGNTGGSNYRDLTDVYYK